MIMQAEAKKIYTTDEYLEFEVNSDTRHEYIICSHQFLVKSSWQISTKVLSLNHKLWGKTDMTITAIDLLMEAITGKLPSLPYLVPFCAMTFARTAILTEKTNESSLVLDDSPCLRQQLKEWNGSN